MIQDNDVQYHFSYLGLDDLASRIICINEATVVDCENLAKTAVPAIDSVIKLNRFPVINLSGNPIILEKYLTALLKHFDPEQFFVLAPDGSKDYSEHKNVGYWPLGLLLQQIMVSEYKQTFDKKYRISALMRQARLHRLELWQAIKSSTTHDDVVVVNKIVEENIPINVKQNPNALLWIKDLPWATRPEFLDLVDNSNTSFEYCRIDHPAYRAYVNITNESWVACNPVFLSEKTWKAYASACLVVNYGSAQVPQVLKNFGFAIWDEYDACLDYQDKIHKIVELFQRDDIEDLYNKNFDLISHNQQLATSWQLAKSLAWPTVEKIQSLI